MNGNLENDRIIKCISCSHEGHRNIHCSEQGRPIRVPLLSLTNSAIAILAILVELII